MVCVQHFFQNGRKEKRQEGQAGGTASQGKGKGKATALLLYLLLIMANIMQPCEYVPYCCVSVFVPF
jgi:hypothetical protein